ncbi:MarR family winged helix-turn-helix transcriptional regulator [Streptosporangium sandarakinum]|uniref:MarR family winged helix-turn-helix transcriptional regulator n=1 Tax=Streptosporangium sandarakinum TaxID=1260955 RepID=UPI00367E437E
MSEHQANRANRADTDGEDDPSAVISAVLTGSRLLVAIAARSLGAVEDRITLPQFRMLVVLTSHGETKLVTMAERLNVNPSTAMRMADRLAASRLVVREVNPRNRRETLMRLTPEGRRIVDEVTARRREEIAGIVSRMSAEQRHALISAMTAFNEAGGEPPVDDAHPLGWPDV